MRSHDSEIVAIYKGCKVTSEEVHLLSEKKPQFLLHNLSDFLMSTTNVWHKECAGKNARKISQIL